MNYIELSVETSGAEQAEVLIALLSELGFEGFCEEYPLLKAYIPADLLPERKGAADGLLREQGAGSFTYIEMGDENWNAVWESNFEPVQVGERCLIRAPFHPEVPGVEIEAVIMPKMSFGTGHHATTHLMAEAVIGRDFTGLEGLDMGSGTGVLAILAVKRRAARVDAVDIDEWAYENCVENIAANGVGERIVPILGGVEAIAGKKYDFILANINRNILMRDIPLYRAALRPGGELVISGILEQDNEALRECFTRNGFGEPEIRVRNGWASMAARLAE